MQTHYAVQRQSRTAGSTTASRLTVKPASDSDKMSSLETDNRPSDHVVVLCAVVYCTLLAPVCISGWSVDPSTAHIMPLVGRQLHCNQPYCDSAETRTQRCLLMDRVYK